MRMSMHRCVTTTAVVFHWTLMVCVILQGCVATRRSCKTIDAGIRLKAGGVTYLFSGSGYIDYDENNEVERGTGVISRIGLGNLTKIDAAVSVPGVANQVLVISGQRFYRYNVSGGQFRRLTSHGRLSEDLGVPSDVDAAFGLGRQMTVIKGCGLWTLNVETARRFERENRTLADWGVSCHLDAAVTLSDEETVIFIKGHTMWKLYPGGAYDGTDEVEGPLHTDDLNICSWFLCGEATFTQPSDDVMACNGDPRLCPLRLDQVTLPGLHNAGAGFSHGFGMFNCWVKNHGKTIYEQLELGIRHLDIDPCYDRCGFLGTCHSYFCGGSICAMIKQTRRFLLRHPGEVVTINFNHEIVEPRKVFRELTRQLKVQLRPMLSSAFRESGQIHWPTLRDSVQSNKRLFVIYAYIIQNEPYARYYRRNEWIHTEHWLGSTWREIDLTPGCSELIPTTERMCNHRQYRELVEVSTVLTPAFSTCVTEMANTCRPRLMDALRTCESYRYRNGKSPNVLLVDYPEVNPQEVTSVFHAVYHQNIRNILQHRPSQCKISIDAAVMVDNKGLIFSGAKVVTYDFDLGMQTDSNELPEELHNIDAAYTGQNQTGITVIKDCFVWQVDVPSFSNTTRRRPLDSCSYYNIAAIDGAAIWNSLLYLFHGCSVLQVDPHPAYSQSIDLESWGLPCNIDAAMTSQDGASMYVFKDNIYWGGDGQSSSGGQIKSWNLDVVRCDED